MIYWLKWWHDYLLFVWRDNFNKCTWWVPVCVGGSVCFIISYIVNILDSNQHTLIDGMIAPVAFLFTGLGGFIESVRKSLDKK